MIKIILKNIKFNLMLFLPSIVYLKNFWLFPFNNLKILSKTESREVKFYNGLKFNIRPNGADLNELLIVGTWGEYPKFLASLIEKNSVIIDAGAHIGSFSISLSKLRPDLKILAIEPSKDNYNLLVKNILLNKMSNKIIPINCAIGSNNGVTRLDLNGESDSWHITNKKSNLIKSELIKVNTMENILKKYNMRRISFLKMDVEGEEYNILLKSEKILKEIPIHIMEYHLRDIGKTKKFDRSNERCFFKNYYKDSYNIKFIKSNLILAIKN